MTWRTSSSRTFEHITCSWHGMSNLAEVSGHVNVSDDPSPEGYYLSRVSIHLRKGHEAHDLNAILWYLQNNRQKIVSSFKQPTQSLEDLLGLPPQGSAKRRR